MAKWILTVDTKGNIKLEAVDFPDSSCLSKTKPLTDLLGEVISQELKPEAEIAPMLEQTQDQQQQVWM